MANQSNERVTLGMGQDQDPNASDMEFESLEAGSDQDTDLTTPVTLGDVKKLLSSELSKLTKNLSEENRRRIQSSSAAAESRIQKQVKAGLDNLNVTVKRLEAAGVQITPAHIQMMKDGIIEEALIDGGVETKPGTAGQNQPQGAGQGTNEQQVQQDLVRQIATQVYKEAGITVDNDDPEAEMVDWSSPIKFQISLTKAALKKKARVGTDPSLRTHGGGSGSSSNDSLQQAYDKELAALPRGGTYPKALVELNMKYRAKGLKTI